VSSEDLSIQWTVLRLVVRISDTARAAQDLQLKVQRAMTGEQRLLMALEMSLFARQLARQRILEDHPDWSESKVSRELLRLAFLPGQLPVRLQ